MGMKITGATICDEVAIDGNEYDGCTFNQAVLVYSGGAHPSFHNCALNGCTVRFSGAAERTLRLMRSFSTSELKQVAAKIILDLFDGPATGNAAGQADTQAGPGSSTAPSPR
jgi:hypothetical protein